MTDWNAWHTPYDDPGSALSQRRAAVRRLVADHLDATAPAPVRVLSLCAGDGQDLLGLLATRGDAGRVGGRLVELDPDLSAAARRAAPAGIEVVTGDAGTTDAATGLGPVDLLMLCGIFGNVTDDDVLRTVRAAPSLCASGGLVVWTRHRSAPDLTPAIRTWFAEAGLSEVGFLSEGPDGWAVGAHRLVAAPEPFVPGRPLFSFVR